MLETGPLSKMDIAALRAADYLIVRLNRHGTEVSAVKEADRTEKNPFAQNQYHPIPATIRIHGVYEGGPEFARAQCFESVQFYHSQNTAASTVAKALRPGDLLTFEFWPDAGNGYVAKAGLHHDSLNLYVERGGRDKRLQFHLSDSICPDNSARMVQGVASKESYYEARKA